MTRHHLTTVVILVIAPLAAGQPAGERELDAAYRRGAEHAKAGRHAQAVAEFERALALARQVYGPSHRETGVALGNLGGTRYVLEEYAQAEPDLAAAVRILGGEPGREDEAATQARLMLGATRVRLGKFADAERELIAGLKSLEARSGADHPDVADALAKLGEAVARQKRPADAEPLHQRALAIREKHLPADAPAVADALDALADLALDTGRSARAEELFRRAAGIRERQEDDYVLARMDPDRFRRYLARVKAAGGATINVNRGTLKLMKEWHFLSFLAERDGRLADAADWADRDRRLRRAMTPILYALTADVSTTGVHDEQAADRMALVLKAPADPGLAAVTLSWSMNNKGILAEVLTEKLRAAKDDPKLAAVLREVDAVRREIATATLAKPAPADAEAHAKLLTKLADRRKELEASSVTATASVESDSSAWVDTSAVRKALPADTVFLDFTRVGREGKQRYAAWVVPPAGKGDVRAFDLGDADTLDALAEALRLSIQAAPKEIARSGEAAAFQKLDKLLTAAAKRVLQPVQALAGGYPNWVISPDADLWVLPWAALPTGDGAFLAERHVLRFLVSGRELAAAKQQAANGPPLVLADPDYDAATVALPGPATSAVSDGGRALVRAGGMSFNRLPGTAVEAKAVRPKLTAWAGAEPIVRLGPDATEAAFRSAARPRAAILSTHGYYLTGGPAVGGTRALKPIVDNTPGGADALAAGRDRPADPLLRCGLALAGANRREPVLPGQDDGVLTGYEIIAADLRGTELIVLSACETGLGASAAGRGVVGLRQAFHLAGAGMVVASLWQVPDQETAELMAGLFDHLVGGLDPAAALIAAQRDQIRRRRGAGGSAHPFYWAAFTASGAGR